MCCRKPLKRPDCTTGAAASNEQLHASSHCQKPLLWLVEDWQEQEVSKVMAKVRHLSVNVQQQPDRFNVVAGFRTAAPTEELCFVKVHLEMDGLRLLATN